jgi:hypothetical protein
VARRRGASGQRGAGECDEGIFERGRGVGQLASCATCARSSACVQAERSGPVVWGLRGKTTGGPAGKEGERVTGGTRGAGSPRMGHGALVLVGRASRHAQGEEGERGGDRVGRGVDLGREGEEN